MNSLSDMDYWLWINLPHYGLFSHDEFVSSAMDYEHWSTVDYLTVVCFPLMNSLSEMDYQLWITSLESAFPRWIYTLSHGLGTLINCGLPRCGLHSSDGFSLCHNNYQLWITSLWCAFPWWIYHVQWIIGCHLWCGVPAVVVCSRIICCLL